MDKIKAVAERSPMGLNQRKRNWWDDEDDFESKWMTGPAAGNATADNPVSMLNQAITDKEAILISQQNRYVDKDKRPARANPYVKKQDAVRPEHSGEQFTFAFIANPRVDTEV